jgi:hypothetical protein
MVIEGRSAARHSVNQDRGSQKKILEKKLILFNLLILTREGASRHVNFISALFRCLARDHLSLCSMIQPHSQLIVFDDFRAFLLSMTGTVWMTGTAGSSLPS